jgi:hypothetical protein
VTAEGEALTGAGGAWERIDDRRRIACDRSFRKSNVASSMLGRLMGV